MIAKSLMVLGFGLMLVGPFLQGLMGSDDPRAIIFAPVMLAASIPYLSGRNLSPNPRIMAQAILLCGAICMGLWYLGGLIGPVAIRQELPLVLAIIGALIAAGAHFLRLPPGPKQ